MNTNISAFNQLALSEPVLEALTAIGYETPSPIQAQAIPHFLDGVDLIGQAQTGTGKTAAFALPTLSKINTNIKAPQVLVLTPTRELAIQVAEAYKNYASKIKGFQVMAVYGGQDYRIQTRALERGPQVVVGTPGRMIDQLKRGNLKLDALKTLVLDEADEMLRMGFIDDVEWILERTPANARQRCSLPPCRHRSDAWQTNTLKNHSILRLSLLNVPPTPFVSVSGLPHLVTSTARCCKYSKQKPLMR